MRLAPRRRRDVRRARRPAPRRRLRRLPLRLPPARRPQPVRFAEQPRLRARHLAHLLPPHVRLLRREPQPRPRQLPRLLRR